MERVVQNLAALIAVVGVGVPLTAHAHIDLSSPASRYGKYNIKSPPCGDGSDTPSGNAATYRAGETITVQWKEYVDHPGHFRIAFDRKGTDAFEAPECTSNCSSKNPTFRGHVNSAVLADLIPDKSGGTYTKSITLPDVTCDHCTLQVTQVMYDKPPFEFPGNDIYYQCADLKLTARSASDSGMDAGDGGGESDTASPVDDVEVFEGVEPAPDSIEEMEVNPTELDTISDGDGDVRTSGLSGQAGGCAVADRRVPVPVQPAAAVLLVVFVGARRRLRTS